MTSEELMHYLEESIADIAIREKLDPIDLLINGFPLSLCQEANARLVAALGELRTQGIINGYSFVATPIGEKMKIDLEIDLPGHIENIEVKMGAGSNGSM